MPTLEIRPLSELRDEAATILAERFARQRTAEPLLPEVSDFEQHVPLAGQVALRGGEAVAYLGGAPDGDLARWGFAGHAAREPEALRDLFAIQAAELGVRRFMLTVPATDPALIDVWFRLGFGCQAVWAVREPAVLDAVEFGGTIRLAEPDDLEDLIDFDQILYETQAATPSFSGFATPSREELRREELGTWDDAAVCVNLLAERNGRVEGWVILYRRPTGDLRVPENNIDIAFAATRPDVRGTGVGLALAHHAFRWANDHGFKSVTTDYRSVNLLSSRFWPQRGFRPQYLRLYRAVP